MRCAPVTPSRLQPKKRGPAVEERGGTAGHSRAVMPSTTSNASHLRHVNVTATSTSSTGIIIPPSAARDGDSIGIAAFGRIFFAVIFATYVFLCLIYLIKIHVVSRLIVGSPLFARRGRRGIIKSSSSSSSSSTDASSSFSSTHDRSRSFRCILSSSSSSFTDLIFAIRLFLLDVITSSDDGRDHGDHRASGGGSILSRHEYHSDERREYRSWSVAQVARWAHMRLHRDRQRSTEEESLTLRTARTRGMGSYYDSPRRDEYDERMAIRTAITALQDQRIHGKSLEYLTLDRLLEFGLAFGVAVDLMSCLDDLIRDNNDNNSKINHDDDQEVALGRFPAWYEGSRRLDNTKEDDISVGDEEMELTERARRIMKDRFGLTLPTLRGQDVPMNENSDPENDSQRCTSGGNSLSKICQDGTTMIASNSDNSNDHNTNMIPLARGRPTAYVIDEMISSMPPHVRAVAERRPDLMSKLFSEREEPRSSVLLQSQYHRRTTVVGTPCVLGEDISLQSGDGVSIDQEIVCLLRRRTNNDKLDAST